MLEFKKVEDEDISWLDLVVLSDDSLWKVPKSNLNK